MAETTPAQMKTVGDLLTRDLTRKIEEIIQVDQADEQSVYAEITEYVATDSIRDQYHDLLKAIAEAPSEPHESVGVWVSGFFGSGKSSFAKNLGYALENRKVLGHSFAGLFKQQLQDSAKKDTRIADLLDLINAKTPTQVILFEVAKEADTRKVTQRIAELMYTVLLRELGYAEDFDIAELEIELESEGKLPQFTATCKSLLKKDWETVRAGAQKLSRASAILHELDPKLYPSADSWAHSQRKALKKAPATVPALVKAYTDDDEPWCLLDTHHRNMESRNYSFDFGGSGEHPELEKLITKAEQRYTVVGSELAKQFMAAYQKSKPPLKGLLQQREIFEKQVKPLLGDGKVAYVWVDALRFEMARELSRLLKNDFALTLQPAVGTIPTITEIGMAALLPKANESAKVVAVGGGKVALEIGGVVVKDRKDRVAFLKENAGVTVFEAKLEDLLPKPTKKVKDGIQGAELILITSQEIDELCEADNVAQARLQIDGVLSHLRRGVRVLADHGIKTIVLVADHGHLFAEEIGEDMKIEAPGGKVEDLHRRVWIGVGGTSEPSYLRTSLASLGVESEFDIATPWTFAVFKSKGGGRAYFHGGMSPQELIVPVVVMRSVSKAAAPSAGIQWTLKPGTAKLTTRFFSVQITGEQSSLFGIEPPTVRIELKANKKSVSLPVSASYGFENATGEVKLKAAEIDNKRIEPNTVTVMVTEEITQKTVGVYLLDATTGAELAPPLTLDVAISL